MPPEEHRDAMGELGAGPVGRVDVDSEDDDSLPGQASHHDAHRLVEGPSARLAFAKDQDTLVGPFPGPRQKRGGPSKGRRNSRRGVLRNSVLHEAAIQLYTLRSLTGGVAVANSHARRKRRRGLRGAVNGEQGGDSKERGRDGRGAGGGPTDGIIPLEGVPRFEVDRRREHQEGGFFRSPATGTNELANESLRELHRKGRGAGGVGERSPHILRSLARIGPVHDEVSAAQACTPVEVVVLNFRLVQQAPTIHKESNPLRNGGGDGAADSKILTRRGNLPRESKRMAVAVDLGGKGVRDIVG